MKIPVLYEDEHLLVVDKPPRLLVVDAPGRSGPTLVDHVQRQVEGDAFAVHRLDEDTTGAVLLARTPEARHALDEMFRRHAIDRIYWAVVDQVPSPAAGKIESRLQEDPRGIVRSVVSGPGKRAVTHFRTLRRGRRVLVECRPETGRRNQIRVHLSELGCPILGDRKYGYRPREGKPVKRLMLHAREVQFAHPITGQPLTVEAPAPEGYPEP